MYTHYACLFWEVVALMCIVNTQLDSLRNYNFCSLLRVGVRIKVKIYIEKYFKDWINLGLLYYSMKVIYYLKKCLTSWAEL